MNQCGKLYGIGVGPGDPELLTLKAVRALKEVDVVFAASSTKNNYSFALTVAEPYLKESCRVLHLGFPMTRDKEVLEKAWDENADLVVETLADGENAAFLTIGDPLIYSTFGYLLKTLRRRGDDLPIEIIPGITSYQAAAARTETVLTESGENLLITSGVADSPSLIDSLSKADNAVILKTYRQFDDLCDTLDGLGLAKKAVLVSSLGQSGERVEKDITCVRGQKLPYLSLLLVKKNGARPEPA